MFSCHCNVFSNLGGGNYGKFKNVFLTRFQPQLLRNVMCEVTEGRGEGTVDIFCLNIATISFKMTVL